MDADTIKYRLEHAKPEGIGRCFWLGLIIPVILLHLTFVAPVMELAEGYKLDAHRFEPTYSKDAFIRQKLNRSSPRESVEAETVALAQLLLGTGDSSWSESDDEPKVGKLEDDVNLTPPAILLMAQHQKAVAEIQARLQNEETWFERKLLFLGVILAGFTARVLLRERKLLETDDPLSGQALRSVFRNPTTLVMLSVAFSVCIVADMHIRANRVVINENGLWIAHYVEPAMMGPGYLEGGATELMGWEKFLRFDPRKLATGGGAMKAGHHTDWRFHLTFWPEIFLTSTAVYGVFCYLFFWQVIHCCGGPSHSLEARLRYGAFFTIHLLIGICAVSTHSAPGAIVMKPFWLPMAQLFGKYPSIGLPGIILGYGCLSVILFIFSFLTWKWAELRVRRRMKECNAVAEDFICRENEDCRDADWRLAEKFQRETTLIPDEDVNCEEQRRAIARKKTQQIAHAIFELRGTYGTWALADRLAEAYWVLKRKA